MDQKNAFKKNWGIILSSVFIFNMIGSEVYLFIYFFRLTLKEPILPMFF
jgi:hypothetical protein